jgi:hypothetical protein
MEEPPNTLHRFFWMKSRTAELCGETVAHRATTGFTHLGLLSYAITEFSLRCPAVEAWRASLWRAAEAQRRCSITITGCNEPAHLGDMRILDYALWRGCLQYCEIVFRYPSEDVAPFREPVYCQWGSA